MRILSFDTSGSDVQIALFQDGLVVLERNSAATQQNRQGAASMLLVGIDAALKDVSWNKRDLDLVVVGVGPGSFTGVRVAVIAARSVGQALALGVVPIPCLEALALRSARPCVVVLDAGGGKIFAAAYDDIFAGDGGQLLPPFWGSTDELNSRLSQISEKQMRNWVLGKGVEAGSFSTGNAVLSFPVNDNLAADAAALAYKRLSANFERAYLANLYPWHEVLPLYLRNPSITLKAGI